MDHPTIARIIDAGETESGQPYFAMELVTGVPLTDYCDDNSLSIPKRLNLFCQVCDGIQHAHQKGIIHRDLKPGNILATEYDGKPMPKIIDFELPILRGREKTCHRSKFLITRRIAISSPFYS